MNLGLIYFFNTIYYLQVNSYSIIPNNVFIIYGISQNPDTKDYIIVLQDVYYKIYYNTSGNEKIDELIQKMRLKINSKDDIVFEWIPYNQFDDIEEVNKGDFATIYSATLKNGPLYYGYDHNDKKYTRKSDKKVALKCLHNSQNISNEFLDEV